jgi:hypothetical protein
MSTHDYIIPGVMVLGIAVALVYEVVLEVKKRRAKTAAVPGKKRAQPTKESATLPTDGASTRPVNQESVPPWAGPMSKEDLDLFLTKIGEHFQKGRMAIEIDAKEGALLVHDEKYQSMGPIWLANLASMCRQTEHRLWPEIIAGHFSSVELTTKMLDELAEKVKDFEQARNLVHVKIYNAEYAAGSARKNIVFREQLPGTVSVIVFDMPESVFNVSQDCVNMWGKTEDELFRLGFRNVREHYPAVIEDQETPDKVVIKVICNDNFFNTTHALLIEHYPDLLGTHGTLLGIPNRGILLAYPINDMQVVAAIHVMLPAIIGMHRDGPGSISTHLYWYREGVYRDLPYTLDGNRLDFTPPDDFVQMLNELAQQSEQ